MSNYPDNFTSLPEEDADHIFNVALSNHGHSEESWANYIDGAMDQLAEAIGPWLAEHARNNGRSWESTILDKAYMLLEAKLTPG